MELQIRIANGLVALDALEDFPMTFEYRLLLRRRAAQGCEACRLDFDWCSDLKYLKIGGDAGFVDFPRGERRISTEYENPSPLAHLDKPVGAKCGHGLAHDRPADAMCFGQLMFTGKLVADGILAAQYGLPEAFADLCDQRPGAFAAILHLHSHA
jgi:hypothetical protein